MFLIACILFFIPLIVLVSLAFRRFPNKLHWISNVLAMTATLCFLWLNARWDILSMYFRMLLPLLLLVAIYMAYRRIRVPEKPWSRAANISTHAVNLVLIVLMSGISWKILIGYPTPAAVIDLASPLRGSNFVVLHGGASPLINGHYWITPQNYALDILGQDRLGRSATAFSDRKELGAYPIFSAPLYSPCDGTVMLAVDEFADQRPPKTDRENLAGNHVMIACKGVEIVLAHMKKDSIRVQPGEKVTTNTVLGEVGNTGNTSEPHLHIHAETASDSNEILDGKGVAFTIDGRFLVRGSRL